MSDLEIAGAIAAIVAAVAASATLGFTAYTRRAQLSISNIRAKVQGPRLHIEVSFYNPGETTVRFHLIALIDGKEVARTDTQGSMSPSHDLSLSVDIELIPIGGDKYQLPGRSIEIAGRTRRRILVRQTVPELK